MRRLARPLVLVFALAGAARAAATSIRGVVLVDLAGLSPSQAEALAREAPRALVFEQAVSQGASILPSAASLMSSQYLQTHGVSSADGSLSTGSFTLAQALEKGGFATGAFVAGPALKPALGFSRGFSVYDFRAEASSGALRGALDAALLWLDARRTSRFFLFIHAERPAGESLDAFRVLRRSLEEKGLDKNTIVVLTASTGPDGKLLSDASIHVPLLVWRPGGTAARVRPVVRLVDLAPALLDWTGLQPPESFQGASLAPLAEGKPAAPRYGFSAAGTDASRPTTFSIRADGWHLVYDKARGESQLYDLKGDPAETKDAQDQHPEVSLDLTQRLMRHLRETRSSGGRREQLSPELLNELREKGYW